MEGSFVFSDRFVRAVIDGAFEDLWSLAIDAPPAAGESLAAALRVPTPYPAAWAASALADFDRAFRWALRSADAGIPLAELLTEGARPVRSVRGMLLVEAEPGSWRAKLDPTDYLAEVFESKPWIVLIGLMTAFGAVDWVVREVVIGEPSVDAPTLHVQYVDERSIAPVVRDVTGNVTITINQNRYELRSGPSERWVKRRDHIERRR